MSMWDSRKERINWHEEYQRLKKENEKLRAFIHKKDLVGEFYEEAEK